MLEEYVVTAIAVASFSLGLFGAALCLMQERDVWPYRALAAVLLVSSAMELETLTLPIADPLLATRIDATFTVLWLIGLTSIVPLFWHYVVAVTSVTPRRPKPLWPHLILPAIAMTVGLATLMMSRAAWQGLFVDAEPLPSGWPLAVGIVGELLIIASVVQWAIYLVAITRALLRYRERLHSYVASTARRELGWVWAVNYGFALYWCLAATDLVFDLTKWGYQIPEWAESLYGLAILVILLLWGLRQKPGLAPDVTPPPDDQKYRNSALTSDMADRLERKLRHAMTGDGLHQDPNLSLWSLSKHIGASPNYVSQTLNENIGESFFDFVNSYRIGTAKSLLQDTDQTVLQIAYDVGFNSRSSFYTAFGKVTGQTPMAYRKAVSDQA